MLNSWKFRSTKLYVILVFLVCLTILIIQFEIGVTTLTETWRAVHQRMPLIIGNNENEEVEVIEDEYYDDGEYEDDPSQNTKNILLWTPFFFYHAWKLPNDSVDERFFKNIGCPETRCILTVDRTIMEPEFYEAVVFHTAIKWESNPVARDPRQLYVFAVRESPEWIYTPPDLSQFNNFFNLTMTYRLDSDIKWLYGDITDKATKKIIAPDRNVKWKNIVESFTDEKLLNLVKNKTKEVAWFVSDCDTVSKRNELVKGLQKHIQVDVYGNCGTLKCDDRKKCLSMLERDYHFYLALENSLCKDYVTEKLFNNLNISLIPVVYGGGDYKKYAPPKSYINANDFGSVKELADYLKFLIDHPEEYVKYFWWKEYYTSGGNKEQYFYVFCTLCQKIHEPGIQDNVQIYSNISKWWKDGMCHRNPDIKF